MCLWPDCEADPRPGSELCATHRAHVDVCMARLIDPLTVAAVERPRPDDSQPYTTRLQRRY